MCTLDDLTKEGEVKLEKIEILSGLAYSAFLTNQGQATLTEGQSLVAEKL